ncbi:unnamed protein product [Polarella glacialis]|uniref:Uncharacterized protein n=1 Tax=Polarella glacialis TaxID=89957 RepID=A0A813GZC5_POLGL|nr:unnamed protein product [Polarella glacialis]
MDGLKALEAAAWSEVRVEGPVPPARLWASLTAVGGDSRRLCLFGGIAPGDGRMLDDAWLLEMPALPGRQGWAQQLFEHV